MSHKEKVENIPFSDCHEWILNEELHHNSHRYFSIIGIKNEGLEYLLIRQEEVGILANLVHHNVDQNYFLLQLKREPGNIPLAQWAPTVQATKSNYERVHNGEPTPYLDFFIKQDPKDVMGSEQGTKFYNKFNRNATRKTTNKIPPVNSNYRWMSARELKEALSNDYCINTDLRSVIATSDWTLYSSSEKDIFFNNELLENEQQSLNQSYQLIRSNMIEDANSFLKNCPRHSADNFEILPLAELQDFYISKDGIYDKNKHRIVAYYDVELPTREVKRWQQPLLCAESIGRCALCYKIENNVAYFFLKAYSEVGYLNRVEFGPSLQIGTDKNKLSENEYSNLVTQGKAISQFMQTDEGSRFFQNKHQYEIVCFDTIPPHYFSEEIGVWFTAGELELICSQSGTCTNELRTCISLLLSFA